jgi:hypothetical protein
MSIFFFIKLLLEFEYWNISHNATSIKQIEICNYKFFITVCRTDRNNYHLYGE